MIDCGQAPTIADGSLVSPCTQTTYGKICSYACGGANLMSGNASITCLSTGQWSRPPLCSTSVVTCNAAPNVVNGVKVGACDTSYNAECLYRCNAAHVLEGNNPSVCGATGWSSPPTCRYVTCGTAPAINYGSLVSSCSTTYGSICTYQCQTGFTLYDNPNITCTASGTWTRAPYCEPTSCSTAPVISGATIVGVCPVNFDSICTYNCNNGYYLNTTYNTIKCGMNGWSPSPKCVYVSCGTQPTVADAYRTCTGNAYNSVCTYTCMTNFTMKGNKDVVCQKSGAWTSSPVCYKPSSNLNQGDDDDGGSGTVVVVAATGGGLLLLAGAGAAAFIFVKNRKASAPVKRFTAYDGGVQMQERSPSSLKTTSGSTTMDTFESSFDTVGVSPTPTRRNLPAAPNKSGGTSAPGHAALYAYGGGDGELSFNVGDVITVDEPVDADGWAKGHLENGSSGFFPWSYVDQKPSAVKPKPAPAQVTRPAIPRPEPTKPAPVTKTVPTKPIPVASARPAPTSAPPRGPLPSAKPSGVPGSRPPPPSRM